MICLFLLSHMCSVQIIKHNQLKRHVLTHHKVVCVTLQRFELFQRKALYKYLLSLLLLLLRHRYTCSTEFSFYLENMFLPY